MCIHIIGRECANTMSRLSSTHAHANHQHALGLATTLVHPHSPAAPCPNFFHLLFYPEIHSQALATQRLNPGSLLYERTQNELSSPGAASPVAINFLRACLPQKQPQLIDSMARIRAKATLERTGDEPPAFRLRAEHHSSAKPCHQTSPTFTQLGDKV